SDHFTAGPDCRVKYSGKGRASDGGGRPTVGAGIISTAGVQKVDSIGSSGTSAPDDHFTAGPHCRVTGSSSGRVDRTGDCPTIHAVIVSSAGIHPADNLVISTPNDHFTAGPHCRVLGSANGRVSDGRGHPRIIRARRITRFGNFGKSVANLP